MHNSVVKHMHRQLQTNTLAEAASAMLDRMELAHVRSKICHSSSPSNNFYNHQNH